MSVYSGFSTRALENEYNQCLLQLITILVKRCSLALSINQLQDDTKFAGNFGKLYGHIQKLEEYKYAPPKYSIVLKELSEQIGIIQIKQSLVPQQHYRKFTLQNANLQQINNLLNVTPSKRQTKTSYLKSNRLKTEESAYNRAIEKSLRYRELEFLCQFD
ncbi:unnamed protein product [Paramecium pentaurelia]|uniref:Uncharacterized protein n=1 Tax=Paramecium pentaurelia TaxID=43138 RepID=A0A8S1STR2_9CILI|nr:unnamed protein product [Paramecium pentaurelia]